MVDEFEQSGSGQIGFSFPGFDSQVFDVGRLSVIACAQLLSAQAHPLRFNANDYHLAIESSSPAKEMMQSSPDFSALFQAGQRERVKALAAQSQRLLLHHCSLASHVKARQGDLQNGDALHWADVLASVAGRQHNADLQRVFLPVSYVYNPSTAALHDLIVALKAKEVDSAAAYRSFPCLSTSGSTQSSAAVGVGGTTPSPARGAASVSPAPAPKRGFFGGIGKKAASTPASPTVVSSPPSTPVTPLTPSSPQSGRGGEGGGELRCLCDPVHLLLLLRTLLHYRRHALSTLLSTVEKTLPALSQSSADRAAMACVEGLRATAEVEKSRVVFVLSVLPKAEEIDREVRRERRERRERRAEQEVRRQAMKEKEREDSLQNHILTAKQAIDAFEREEGASDEDGGSDAEDRLDDSGDEETPSGGSSAVESTEVGSVVEHGGEEDSPTQTSSVTVPYLQAVVAGCVGDASTVYYL